MMEHIKSYSFFILLAILAAFVSSWLQSEAILEFLYANLITLLIALLAINTTTLSVVMTKLSELSEKHGHDFSRTISDMKLSIKEQVVLIVITAVFLLISGSELIKNAFQPIVFISNVVLISVFFISLHILYDTAKSIFIIMNYEAETNAPPRG